MKKIFKQCGERHLLGSGGGDVAGHDELSSKLSCFRVP